MTLKELVTDALYPEQNGHPLPPEVRSVTVDCHSWSGPLGHCHQAFLLDPKVICSGVSKPLLMGCHSPANSGLFDINALVTETFLPAQNGHPVSLRGAALLAIAPCHSWSEPASHFHQTLVLDPDAYLSGVKSPFLVGCH